MPPSAGNGRKSVAGSLIGGVAETQEVIDYCAARGIKADVEVVCAEDINRAFERVVNRDVRYRFVIDMASLADVSAARRLGAATLTGGIELVLSAGDLGLDGVNDRAVYEAASGNQRPASAAMSITGRR